MKRIDFENGSQFIDQLVLTVVDSAGLNSSALLNITMLDMNDNSPIFSQTVYYTSVRENPNSSAYHYEGKFRSYLYSLHDVVVVSDLI